VGKLKRAARALAKQDAAVAEALDREKTRLKFEARREVLQDMRNMLQGIQNGGGHVLVLNDYQVANLRAAIHAAGYGSVYRSPLNVLNNGDWLGELFQMLPAVDQRPNTEPEQLAEAANRWKSLR